MDEPVIPDYGGYERTFRRYWTPGFVSIVCFVSVWVWLWTLHDQIPDGPFELGLWLWPIGGILAGVYGLWRSRIRSIAAWIGMVLNILMLGLKVFIEIYGVGMS